MIPNGQYSQLFKRTMKLLRVISLKEDILNGWTSGQMQLNFLYNGL